jgi:hypothetical protein
VSHGVEVALVGLRFRIATLHDWRENGRRRDIIRNVSAAEVWPKAVIATSALKSRIGNRRTPNRRSEASRKVRENNAFESRGMAVARQSPVCDAICGDLPRYSKCLTLRINCVLMSRSWSGRLPNERSHKSANAASVG